MKNNSPILFLSRVEESTGIRKISVFLLPSRGRQQVGIEHGHLRVRILLFFKSTAVWQDVLMRDDAQKQQQHHHHYY